MDATVDEALISKIRALTPQQRAEVENFVEFLAAKEERAAAAKRISEGLARLDALGLPALSEEEVAAEVEATRRERFARQGG